MNVSYQFPKLSIKGEIDSPSFCLADTKGSFFFFSPKPISKFNGFFANFDLDMYKILESVSIKDDKIKSIESHLDFTKLLFKDFNMKLYVLERGLSVKLSKKKTVLLDFDFKKGYDSREFGRFHDISFDKKDINIRFTKKTDEHEDSVSGKTEWELFCVIHPSSSDIEMIDEWKHSYYSYDEVRKDSPFERHVYCPFEITCKGFDIAVGKTIEEAKSALKKVRRGRPPKYSLIKLSGKDQSTSLAFACAQRSLQNLFVDHRILAGYPWFYQFWTRDESISSIGLTLTGKEDISKDILLKYIDMIDDDGRIPNRLPSSSLGCADGVGWVWKRLRDIFNSNPLKFSVEKRNHMIEQLKKSIARIEKHFKVEGLIHNNPKETWMDTEWQHIDQREGYCIEIQTQFLNMLRFAYELTKENAFKTKLDATTELVRSHFFDGQFLADMKDDFTIRPNIFIAYYTYPELLSNDEWKAVFENSLLKLWLPWGGISSIDTYHRLFTPNYTGATNQSYHRGDSWFWINNLVAICLGRVDKEFFKEKINRILEASTHEILWSGSMGDHAEVSDASHLASKGCLSQAWSSAMFIEAVLETQ